MGKKQCATCTHLSVTDARKTWSPTLCLVKTPHTLYARIAVATMCTSLNKGLNLGKEMDEEREIKIYQQTCLKLKTDKNAQWKFFANALTESLVQTTRSGVIYDEREEIFVDEVLAVVKKSWKDRLKMKH